MYAFFQEGDVWNAKAATEFVRKCQLMSTLDHPNIVQFLGVALFPGSRLPAIRIITERLLPSLHDLLAPDTPLPSGAVTPLSFFSMALKCSLLHNVACGLAYLHEHMPLVIHYNLSARNVLLDSEMVAKIADLGVARIVAGAEAATRTQGPGALVYMPPEAFLTIRSSFDATPYDASIDIFSFGVIAIFTIGGIFPCNLLPYTYVDENETALLVACTELQRRAEYMRYVNEQLRACGQLRGDHPLIRLIQQCLQNNMANRPAIQDVLHLLEEARAVVRDEGSERNKRELVQSLPKIQVMTDERAQQLIDEAMELGSLQQRNVVGVITGLMGAGKTTLLSRLFGLAPPDFYTSTGVAEQSIRGFLHHILRLSAGVWQRLSYKDIREFLAPLIQAGMRKSDVDKLASCLMRDLNVQSAKPLDPLLSSTPKVSSQEEATPFVPTSPQLHEESPSCQEIFPLVTTATPKSLTKDLILELVHMIDTGGQPELMEVMPSLIHNANLALVLLDLRYGLDERSPVDRHEQGECYKRQFQSHYTSRDVILKLASTLHAKKSQNKAFRLIIVATHRDCVEGNVATRIKALNHQLASLLLPAFKGQLILFQSPDKIAFVLDLKKPDRDDKEALQLIRTKVGEPGLGTALDTPTSFFVFEQDLLQFAEKDAKRYILSLDECKLVGARLRMSGEMVEAALVLFHRQNTFLHFRHILPNHVFIKPQVPLDIVNGIVGFSYKVNAGEFKGFPAKFVGQLRQGIITEEMLSFDKISPHFQEGVYEVKDAIKLFCHTFTIAPLEPEKKEAPIATKSKEYLMMCLKAPIPKLKLVDYLPECSDTVPLVVKFSSGCVPLGCFGSTISCLLSKYGWEVVRKAGSPKCLAHNIASLRDPDLVVETVLVDFIQHLEIHISTPIDKRPSPAKICTEIRRKLFGAIDKVFTSMQLDPDQIKVSPAFPCTCTHPRHYAEFTKENVLLCSESSIFDPNPKQSMWMGGDTDSKPDLGRSAKYIKGLQQHYGLTDAELGKKCEDEHLTAISGFISWDSVGPYLKGVTRQDMKDIRKDGESEQEKRWMLIDKWEETGSEATYCAMIAAMEKAKKKNEAEKVCKLLRPQHEVQYGDDAYPHEVGQPE